MNELRVDDRFSKALEAELVARVQKASPARARKRTRMWLGTGVLAGAGILGGVGAAAAGLFVIPGSQEVTPLSTAVDEVREGTATIELGDPPAGTTGIQVELNCLTPGRFEFQDGAYTVCEASAVGTPQDWSGYTLPLTPGLNSVTIKADSGSRWRLSAKYVNSETTDWAVNADGNSYGAENEKGTPDLTAVIATNGVPGYVYTSELEDATGTAAIKTFKTREEALAWQEARRGKTFSVPVYDSTGKTVVGEFVISDGQGQITDRTVPPGKPAQ
ncbi:peptidase M56 family protein [Arthrobacter globiformis NBRC 12137]|uniref:Peptidase M56 family protein n=1 Tax=Arthrobacter globiformis (strain ATCC 8010 / DSM 20124 / JCM 1332 / NBRC 12137 / NCIMB 8907 / NRRL B-2979 / 168) TaxID=1077972 RepID=H0QJ87_ARTG1|nr:hypothetical protein [Arthrobacter globiformis]GAB12888.1 peptidase M56 family protein [Arthrobacter globiformis NBRC 12137]